MGRGRDNPLRRTDHFIAASILSEWDLCGHCNATGVTGPDGHGSDKLCISCLGSGVIKLAKPRPVGKSGWLTLCQLLDIIERDRRNKERQANAGPNKEE